MCEWKIHVFSQARKTNPMFAEAHYENTFGHYLNRTSQGGKKKLDFIIPCHCENYLEKKKVELFKLPVMMLPAVNDMSENRANITLHGK